ncbi:MAG TPA: hypothetical protein VNN80_13510 [Polyangiaceae bacterium]|jgi:hypothetical protein|nr:hypothetical protein [Polyangiaceae bacterium]
MPSLALAATPSDVGQRHAASTQLTSQQSAPQAVTHGPQKKGIEEDRMRYAAKEGQSGDAKDFRGGDTIVIGATAVAAILAVVLLLVLL